MRILAIRGANLASLKGPFEVDLQKPPLCHLGLFAIAGPVGAGKSTLLDALCLALFNRTPRLSGRGGSTLLKDGEALRANDPRSLVRRGAASGFAEVDFLGADGRTWRARWLVRRARGQAFGRLQDEVLCLTDVDNGERVGDGKEDTLEKIHARLGLTFDEFCRSVLLAQGGFSSFLKARADERAALLEKITGTDLYSTLSIQAHTRARDEQQRQKMLEDALAAVPFADVAARADLERCVVHTETARAEASAELERAEALLRHADRAALLRAGVADAEVALTSATQARAGSAAAADVAALERAWPLRAPLLQRAQATRAAAAAEQAHTGALLDERRASGALESAREHRLRADEALAFSARALADAEPALRDAVVLDEQIVRAGAGEVRAAHERAVDELAAVNGELEGLRTMRAITAGDLHRAEEVLAREPAMVALIPSWTALTDDLAQLASADTDVEGARALAAAAERNRHEAAAQLTDSSARHARDAAAHVEALHRFQQFLPGVALDDAAQPLAEIAGAHMQRRALGESRARLAERARFLAAAVAEARASEVEATAALERETVELQRCTDIVVSLERAAHRATLVDGAPCPVCGSLEHPAAGDHAVHPEASGLEQARARRVVAEAALRDRLEVRAATRARVDEIGRAHAHAHAEWARAEAELSALAVPLLDEAPLDDARAAHRHARTTRDALRLVEAERAEHASTVAVLEQSLALHASMVAAREHARAERAASIARRLHDVAAAAELAQPRVLWTRLKPRVEGLRAQQQQAAAARTALAQREPHLRSLEQRQAAAAERESSLHARAVEAALHERVLVERRATLLGGEAAAAVRGRLTAALEEARTGAAEATAALAAAEVRAQEAEARRRTADDRARTTSAERAHAESAVERLQAVGRCDDALLERVAALPDNALDDARGRVRSLDDAVARAEAVLAERRLASASHDDTPPGPAAMSADDARAALTSANEAWAAARTALLRDDDARLRADELLPEVAAQRARAGTWQRLSDVIGSADGARFRVFAQSLTLDALLVHANAQLATLAPRYRLDRAPTDDKRPRFDLELVVVDRESGDEPRSVGSLSGGETFLVSLALALGLSALSAVRTSVESLFIDEGFSSLDPETLEAALAALEALRATGRQIGVISHVPALVERIGAQVRVVPLGGGRSRVELVS